ncbi:hypothetical protein AB0F91_17530 [Amycolatopsis sp. NPDC023774]|uniref:hypothetical protein n=1 Tax=Amycolatopsis sp. NPDC023774 TaxID=3155015 RepID=UPI0033DF48AC
MGLDGRGWATAGAVGAEHQQIEGGVAQTEVDVRVPAAAHVLDRVGGAHQDVLLGQVAVEGVDGQGCEEAVLSPKSW